jgi:predicted transcriptional regulator
MLRTPVVTARGLADSLTVTPQAALGLLRQLIAVGVVREATGRAALARLHHDIDHAVLAAARIRA